MRISKLWFWITPSTSVLSIFAFAFGISALSLFLTGQESVDMWTVLKTLETLPDPREFITGCMKVFNVFANLSKKIPSRVNAPGLVSVVLTGIIWIIKALLYAIGIIAVLVVSFVSFPLYCVFFTIRCCSAMLVWIGIDVPYISTMTWTGLFGGLA